MEKGVPRYGEEPSFRFGLFKILKNFGAGIKLRGENLPIPSLREEII